MLFCPIRKNKEQIYLLNRKCNEIEIKTQKQNSKLLSGQANKGNPFISQHLINYTKAQLCIYFTSWVFFPLLSR